jgi:hypothetical protein
MTDSMCLRFSLATSGDRLTTLETVLMATPARAATSANVTGERPFRGGFGSLFMLNIFIFWVAVERPFEGAKQAVFSDQNWKLQ